MKFNFSLPDIILSTAKMKIVTFLLNHEAAMSEREIASVLSVSHMSINRLLKEMAGLNLVNYVTIGKAHLWKVNRRSYAFQVFSELIGNISKMKTPLEDLKKTILGNLPGSLIKKIILFGSVAKGLESEDSDIDIFVLVKNLEMKKKVENFIDALSIKCFELYGNRLAPYVLTEHEMKQRSNLNVIKEIKNGIEIFPASRGSNVT
jgi:predicted nucleotidyltransferase